MKNEERLKEGKKAALIGIIGNIFLTFFNIAVGIISGSYALISEGLHTFSDIITSVISYIGFRIGQRPADKEHPFGHGRSEAIAGLIIVLFLAMVSYEILTGAIDKILNYEDIITPNYLAAIMAFIGIIINTLTSRYIISLGKKINSPAIVADGNHQKVDIYSSIAILASVIISQLGFPIFDPIVGFIIGILILKTAFEVGIENVNNIMGKVSSKELINEIKSSALSVNHVLGVHNIKVDYFGTYAIVSLHIDLDSKLTLVESHEIVHNVQNNVSEEIAIVKSVTVHACPYGEIYNHKQEIDI
ncbi:MAG: cation diffusion facilitator family transporter [Methanobacteriaceae archaeon]|jgi:cation diffusion facilitator family transporter|nr:cation diffusion facilitator family transporter [Methanobacteriaceae archaeon]